MASVAQLFSPTPIRAPAQYYSPNVKKKFSTEVGTGPLPAPTSAKYADIGYAFDERKYLERSEARLRAGGLPTTVPRGWPEALHGPLVWTGADFPDESVFIYHLTAQDKEEIAAALRHFKTLGKQGKHVSRESFPLPNLQEKLLRIREDVFQNRGFAILRGLDVDAFGEIDLVTVYLGLTSYVAELRGRQNHRGATLSTYGFASTGSLRHLPNCLLSVHVVNSSEAAQAENATVEMVRPPRCYPSPSGSTVTTPRELTATYPSSSPSTRTWSATS